MCRRLLVMVVMSAAVTDFIVCPPVTDKQPSSTPAHENEEDVVQQLAYDKYLKEVMALLMTDKEFANKVQEAGTAIMEKSGEIAKHLDFVGHGIRTKLDEIKRKEVDRLRQIIRLQMKLQHGTNDDDDDDDDDRRGSRNLNLNVPSVDKERLLAHLDHSNPNTFEIEDLSKLIKQATQDLEDIDEKRRSEFKSYEMTKEHRKRKDLEKLDEEKRAAAEKKYDDMKKKHADHPKLHHPGAEAQLKEVWEDSDGLNKKDFDPRTFFYLHDTNGDNRLDESELEALFQKELDKAYDPNASEDDMVERYEEMNRMREHVMKEVDKDQDRLVSLEEFLESTRHSDFKRDEGWDTLDQKKLYTDEELAEFEKEYDDMHGLPEHTELDEPMDNLQRHDAPPGVNVMHQAGEDKQQQQQQDQKAIPQPVQQQQQAIAQPVQQQQPQQQQREVVEAQHPDQVHVELQPQEVVQPAQAVNQPAH